MSQDLEEYGLGGFFDDIGDDEDPARFIVHEFKRDEESYLLVSEERLIIGGQHLFRAPSPGQAEHIFSDNVIDIDEVFSRSRLRAMAGRASSHDVATHELAHAGAVARLKNYSSSGGPSGGRLACMWAMRKIVEEAIGVEIHKTDGTKNFFAELKSFQPDDLAPDDIPAGGVVISPTEGRKTGHVGMLGPQGVPNRVIYSNSSSRTDADGVQRPYLPGWVQNYTWDSWRRSFERRGLPTYVFFLPKYSPYIGA